MNLDYNVVPLNGGSQFDLNGVRFNGKSFMFWKMKNNQPIKEVAVILDKKYENIKIHDWVVILSLKGLTNYRDIRDAIFIFQQIMNHRQLQFRFVVGNEQERQITEGLGRELQLSYVVQDMNLQNREKEVQLMETEMQKNVVQDFSTGGNRMIEKNDNGQLKQIMIHNGATYENSGTLSGEEEKMRLRREWMKDPIEVQRLNRLESENQQVAMNKVGEVAMKNATQEDGGITQNNVSNVNQYSMVGQREENVQVVNSSVINSNIGTSGISSTSASNVDNYQDNQKEEKKEQKRENVNNTYVYKPDSNVRFGQSVGYLDDYKDLRRNNTQEKVKIKVKTKRNLSNDRAAFVSFPVIIFILSALLLIASIVLLFVIE